MLKNLQAFFTSFKSDPVYKTLKKICSLKKTYNFTLTLQTFLILIIFFTGFLCDY